jgi:hypothetical protein
MLLGEAPIANIGHVLLDCTLDLVGEIGVLLD